MMKIVIVDCSSIIGENLASVISREIDCELFLFSTDKSNINAFYNCDWIVFDKWDKKELKKHILKIKPDVIINCLSYDGIEDCEENRSIAWDYNVDMNTTLVSAAKICESHYITFSNEALFDGLRGPYSENDIINAYSYYAKSMLARENTCKTELQKYTVFRLTDLFGYSSFGKIDFVSKFIVLFEAGIDLEVPNSHYTNPIFAVDVSNAVIKAFERQKYGFFHLGGADYLNRYEIANLIAKIYGFEDDLAVEKQSENILKMGLIPLKAETDLRLSFSKFENALVALKFSMDSTDSLKYL